MKYGASKKICMSSIKDMYHFTDQLWKTSGNKLINKKLQVQNKPQSDNEWNLPCREI